jgi:catechol 2,3-dioxygenase-like lactoylglutathione lyase family enzyme
MILGLDHVPVVVEDLDAAAAGFEALLGAPPVWRGRLPGVRHAFFEAPGFALDVIAPDGEGPAGDQARARLARHGPGPSAIGWRVADLDAAMERLERRGLAGGGHGVTVSTAEDGRERAWPIGLLRARPTGGLSMFLVQGEPATDGPSRPVGGAVVGLDHVVVETEDPERAVALYGGRLGLDLRLDRTHERFGARMLFFRCGPSVVEIVSRLGAAPTGVRDKIGGLAWRVSDATAARAQCASAGFDVSEVRAGRKPGTRVFTVRNAPAGVPTLFVGPA